MAAEGNQRPLAKDWKISYDSIIPIKVGNAGAGPGYLLEGRGTNESIGWRKHGDTQNLHKHVNETHPNSRVG
jgi:hypothetical protein